MSMTDDGSGGGTGFSTAPSYGGLFAILSGGLGGYLQGRQMQIQRQMAAANLLRQQNLATSLMQHRDVLDQAAMGRLDQMGQRIDALTDPDSPYNQMRQGQGQTRIDAATLQKEQAGLSAALNKLSTDPNLASQPPEVRQSYILSQASIYPHAWAMMPGAAPAGSQQQQQQQPSAPAAGAGPSVPPVLSPPPSGTPDAFPGATMPPPPPSANVPPQALVRVTPGQSAGAAGTAAAPGGAPVLPPPPGGTPPPILPPGVASLVNAGPVPKPMTDAQRAQSQAAFYRMLPQQFASLAQQGSDVQNRAVKSLNQQAANLGLPPVMDRVPYDPSGQTRTVNGKTFPVLNPALPLTAQEQGQLASAAFARANAALAVPKFQQQMHYQDTQLDQGQQRLDEQKAYQDAMIGLGRDRLQMQKDHMALVSGGMGNPLMLAKFTAGQDATIQRYRQAIENMRPAPHFDQKQWKVVQPTPQDALLFQQKAAPYLQAIQQAAILRDSVAPPPALPQAPGAPGLPPAPISRAGRIQPYLGNGPGLTAIAPPPNAGSRHQSSYADPARQQQQQSGAVLAPPPDAAPRTVNVGGRNYIVRVKPRSR